MPNLAGEPVTLDFALLVMPSNPKLDVQDEEVLALAVQFPDSQSRALFRSMIEGNGGAPLTGPTARSLGVRPGADIPVGSSGRVAPRTGGMSVSPDAAVKK
jgi:hypothetical protein